jgi:hypothetical protein
MELPQESLLTVSEFAQQSAQATNIFTYAVCICVSTNNTFLTAGRKNKSYSFVIIFYNICRIQENSRV